MHDKYISKWGTSSTLIIDSKRLSVGRLQSVAEKKRVKFLIRST